MPVLPPLLPLLQAMAGADALLSADLPLAEKRELIHLGMAQGGRFAEPMPDDVVCRDLEAPADHPQPGVIRVRTYTPPGDAPVAGRPAHLFLHGGAWWLGTVEHFDAGCGNLAALADCVVVSVDYRLAPEHPYPVPLEDGIAAWLWLHEHAVALGVDPTRMSIGGGSAGGNLAAAACLALRDRGCPMPVAQALTVPATDLSLDYPSVAEYGAGYGLDASLVRQAVAFYLGDHGDPADPYVSPMRAATLAGLPPALVMTCEYDPGRDAAEAYARRLAEAGIPTTLRRWDGFVHNAHIYTALLPEAREFRAVLVAFLREHHKTTA
ncbi:alpha/beta hydrolase [Streptomycetaceae bacterium NBC_01309]